MRFHNALIFVVVACSASLSAGAFFEGMDGQGVVSGVVRPVNSVSPHSFAASDSVTILGVHVSKIEASLAMHLGLPENIGLLVEHVTAGSAAEKAKLAAHDVLHRINNQLLVNPEQLAALVQMYEPGTKVTLTVVRASKTIEIVAVLQERPNAKERRVGVNQFDAFEFYHGKTEMKEFQNCSLCHASTAADILKDEEFDNYEFFHGRPGPHEFQNCSACHTVQRVPLDFSKSKQ